MARFGGKKYSPDYKAKGAAYYGLSDRQLHEMWELYNLGRYVKRIIEAYQGPGKRSRAKRLSLKKLIPEWGALGYPVWELRRRAKIRMGIRKLVERFKDQFDIPTTAVMYAALAYAEAQGADLRALLVDEFGQAPKRAMPWHLRAERRLQGENRENQANDPDRTDLPDAAGAG